MENTIYLNENDNRRTSFWLSVIFHLILLFLFLVPCFNYFNNEPPNLQGVVIALGVPDSEEEKKNPEKQIEEVKTAPKPVKKPVASKPTKVKTVQSEKKETNSKIVQEESDVIAGKKSKEKTKAEIEKEEKLNELKELEEKKRLAEEKARMEAEAEKARKEEEARKKKEAKSKAKSKFSSLFGSGSDQANDSKGDENGKPDASVLEGLSTGSGKVGSGLGDRGVLYIPTIQDNTQKTGKVVVKICVDKSGKVISSQYTQKGSTTTDAHLINVAEKNAKKYKFSKSTIEEQCGNVIIDFKLR